LTLQAASSAAHERLRQEVDKIRTVSSLVIFREGAALINLKSSARPVDLIAPKTEQGLVVVGQSRRDKVNIEGE
jgi:hypothetical protein